MYKKSQKIIVSLLLLNMVWANFAYAQSTTTAPSQSSVLKEALKGATNKAGCKTLSDKVIEASNKKYRMIWTLIQVEGTDVATFADSCEIMPYEWKVEAD